jgi:hypothetical protein
MLLETWLGSGARATRDIDLAGYGSLEEDELRRVFLDVLRAEVEPDGVEFHPQSLRIEAIQTLGGYGGSRIRLDASLAGARLHLQIDIGIGDAVEPPASWTELPGLLDFPGVRLRAYCPETVIAEKLHTLVVFDVRTSRMKDFHDIHALANSRSFEREILVKAVRATFSRRGTQPPDDVPGPLRTDFGTDGEKSRQWTAFVRNLNPEGGESALPDVLSLLQEFLLPVLEDLRTNAISDCQWAVGGPWRSRQQR